MAKRIKRDKVNRSYDGIDREESTAGIMFLRILVILIIILFIAVATYLFIYNVQRETANDSDTISENEINAFYQTYDTDVSEDLILYSNNSNPLGEYYKADIEKYSDSIEVNSLMLESLEKMAAAAQRDGIKLDIVCGYMTDEDVDTKFQTLKLAFEEEGATLAESESKARAIFPPSTYNEFCTGMLIRISNLDSEDFSKTEAYSWLYKNGINYGFINRYTQDKESYTGINEDLTVYRFVGTENAGKMRSFGMCLEEYSDYCSYR